MTRFVNSNQSSNTSFINRLRIVGLYPLEIEQVTNLAVEIIAESFDDVGFIFPHIISYPTSDGVIRNAHKGREVFKLDTAAYFSLPRLDKFQEFVS